MVLPPTPLGEFIEQHFILGHRRGESGKIQYYIMHPMVKYPWMLPVEEEQKEA